MQVWNWQVCAIGKKFSHIYRYQLIQLENTCLQMNQCKYQVITIFSDCKGLPFSLQWGGGHKYQQYWMAIIFVTPPPHWMFKNFITPSLPRAKKLKYVVWILKKIWGHFIEQSSPRITFVTPTYFAWKNSVTPTFHDPFYLEENKDNPFNKIPSGAKT